MATPGHGPYQQAGEVETEDHVGEDDHAVIAL
jgi:hypothetical protein